MPGAGKDPAMRSRALLLAAALVPLAAFARAQSDGESPIAEAVTRANAALARVAALPDDQRTYANTVLALDDVQATFFEEARMAGFMADVSPDAEERARGRRAKADLSDWFTVFGKREDLYRALLAYEERGEQLDGEPARLLRILLRDFRREGMDLPAEQRARLLAIDRELDELGIEFSRNIADDETKCILTAAELRGVPQGFLDTLPRTGGLYLCDTKGATLGRIIATCEVEETREKIAVASSLRGGRKNVDVLERMLVLRSEKAHLLGYAHLADYVTETRMAKDARTVWAFYEELRPKLRKKAELDFAEFQAAKRAHTGDPEAVLQAWDFSFYRAYLSRTKYAVDQEKVREYFPMEAVRRGIFDVTQRLFGVRYTDITEEARAAGRPIWHPDVRLYTVHDTATGDLLGEFYTDLHPREGKYSHAAQFPLVLRKRWSDGRLTRPLVALVCNFTKPTPDRPALLSHDEVETYFHEFGHCLHSVFSQADMASFSGTQVARDFVEAPSQMLENWIWDRDVLAGFAKHYETGEPLPDEVLDGLLAAKNLGSGIATEAQVFLGTMDFLFHTDPDGVVDTTAVRADAYRQCRLFEPLPELYSQASFGHLNGYEAGYYGYLWSLVYAQDMFSRFEAEGLMNTDAAREYRREVLSRGGTRDELDMVRAFLGREPNSDAFLRHLGLE
jgi:thimet oligopeptidase